MSKIIVMTKFFWKRKPFCGIMGTKDSLRKEWIQ